MFGRKIKLNLAVAEATMGFLRERIETLTKEKSDLVDQVSRLQDAFISKEAPEAYRDRLISSLDTKIVPEQVMTDMKIMNKYMEELKSDRPIFETADDLISLVSMSRGAPQSHSIHGNDES